MMGLERIVPTPDDLAVMLQVLARSATGQTADRLHERRHRPAPRRRPGRPDELHVVIVDNGRSRHAADRARGDPLLHPLRRLPERVPGVPGDRRPRLRHRLSGPGGRVFTPGAFGRQRVGRPAAGEQPVRRLPRGVPGAHRHPAHAAGPACRQHGEQRGPGVGAGRPACIQPGRDAALAVPPRRTARPRRPARPSRDGGRIERLPGPLAGWTQYRTFPPMAPETFTARYRRTHRRPA